MAACNIRDNGQPKPHARTTVLISGWIQPDEGTHGFFSPRRRNAGTVIANLKTDRSLGHFNAHPRLFPIPQRVPD